MNNLNNELIDILTTIKEKVTDDSDLLWISFDTAEELRKHIDRLIARLHFGDKDVLNEICGLFAPTSTFQELSMQNGWSDEYMKIASKFDKLYEQIR